MAGPQTSSSGQIVAALVVSTLIGVGGGAFLGSTLGGEPPGSTGSTVADKPAEGDVLSHAGGEKAEKGHGAHGTRESAGKDAPPSKMRLKELAPIVTNLASPETGWVRLQAAIVYDAEALPQPDILISEVTADIVTFLRTMTLASIQGADGLRRLHEDLSERAVIRSEGRIREFIIQALVVQ